VLRRPGIMETGENDRPGAGGRITQ